jgi:hypothetical protein
MTIAQFTWILPFSWIVNKRYLILKSTPEHTYNNMSVHLARWWKNHTFLLNKLSVPDSKPFHTKFPYRFVGMFNISMCTFQMTSQILNFATVLAW